jgi:hypothetical protein
LEEVEALAPALSIDKTLVQGYPMVETEVTEATSSSDLADELRAFMTYEGLTSKETTESTEAGKRGMGKKEQTKLSLYLLARKFMR